MTPQPSSAVTDRGYASRVSARSKFDRHKISDTTFRDIHVVDEFEGRTVALWDRDLTYQLKDFVRGNAESGTPRGSVMGQCQG